MLTDLAGPPLANAVTIQDGTTEHIDLQAAEQLTEPQSPRLRPGASHQNVTPARQNRFNKPNYPEEAQRV